MTHLGPIRTKGTPTQHPAWWFGFGVFASFALTFALSPLLGETAGRWTGEVGIYMGWIGAMFFGCVVSAIFAAWFAFRHRSKSDIFPSFLAPLFLGILFPWISVACMTVFVWLFGVSQALNVVGAIVTFGGPAVLAEITIQLTLLQHRWRLASTQKSADVLISEL